MTVDGGPQASLPQDAQTRGFLFADLRGYTEYLERNGATAASELLARYRAIVRATVAEHRGAEIRTEGDSFYIVLPTASGAVRCAMAIVERVEAENARQPENAIRVGIGVHAGEAIETDQGLVGSAVNIAARLSAIARPGEVLLSETVRALTRSVIPVRYVARGRHRLKGVAEPQEVFSAVSASTPVVVTRPRWRSRPVALLGVVAIVLVAALAYTAFTGGLAAGPTPSPTSAAAGPTPSASAVTPTSSPSAASPSASLSVPSGSPGPTIIRLDPDLGPLLGAYLPLLPGSYRFNSFRPIVVLDVDPTWTDRAWYPRLAGSDIAMVFAMRPGIDTAYDGLKGPKKGMVILDFVRLQTVLGNPCDPGDTTSYEVLGGNPRDVVDWLSTQQFLAATNVQPVAVGGWTGLSVDVTVTGDPGKVCSGVSVPGQGSVNLFKTATQALGYTGIFKIREGFQDHFVVLDVGEDTPLVLIAECNVADCATLLPWAQDLIDTITVSVDSPP